MQQSDKIRIGAWAIYKKHVQNVVLNKETDQPGDVSYWRNAVFCNILTYLTPLSLIALVPSAIMVFVSELGVIGFADLFTFSVILLLTICPGIKIELRKAIFIIILFCLSVTLIYFLPFPAPGLLFALAVTILSSLIYSSAASYVSSWANTVICIFFALLIYFDVEWPLSSVYNLGSWIAISSNLVLLSFAFSKCMDLLLAGLTASLTENKITEAKLERTNRLYKFNSQINQTIVHVKDAETLFSKSCSIAIEYGKYQMAWIGSFDEIQKKIMLIESCGISAQDIELFNNLPNNSNGPGDYVLRNGKYFLCNNMEQLFEIKSWKLFAEKHQIGSFIVLPIKKRGNVFGTFNLFAKEPNYFGQDDILSLEEVTADISFALEMFEKAKRHKEAEIELQKNYALLEEVSEQRSAIFNTIPASIALINHEGNILNINDEWVQFGRENGIKESYEYFGKNYVEISEKSLGKDLQDGQRMAQGLKEVLSGAINYFTMEYACDSLTLTRWFQAEVRPFRSHNLTGAVVMHFNISERKKAESEMLLLINNTEESFILLNKNLQIVSFNNQFKNLYQKYFGLEILKGDLILNYTPPDRRELVASIYEKVLKGNVQESEIVVPGLNNTNHYFSLKYSPAKDEAENIFGAFVTLIDITEKKKALEQKEFERRNKEALINSTDDLIWSISIDSKLIAANNAFINEMKKFTGVEIKAGDDFLSYDEITDESIKNWSELYKKAFSGESFKTEIYNPATELKNESWIDASFSPIHVNDQMVGIACYSRDITERKKAEEKIIYTSKSLQQALNDLNKVMDSSLDVICAVDEEGIFLKVSAASETVWGYKPEELIGKPIFSIVYNKDRKKTETSASNVMAGSDLTYFENRYVHKDGTLVPMEWTARWDEKDKIRYGVARDVTEKKRMQKAIESERQRFYDLFTEAPSSMGVLSGPNHVFVMVNPLYLKLIGKNDVIGKSVKEVLPEAVEQGFVDLLDAVYNTGKTFTSDEMHIKLDTLGTGLLVDKYLNFMYQAHRNEDDKIEGILFFAVDVTEQVVLRKKIEENQSKLKEAQRLLHISNWEVDLASNLSTWSDEFYQILGLRRNEVVPSPEVFLSQLHPEDTETIKATLEKTFQTFEADSFTARIISKKGIIKYIFSEWNFEFDENNKPIRLYGILQDVTERKIAELERAKITNDLIQRNRDLEQFTFIISHNLRAPTANIIGFTDYLQKETLTHDEQQQFLHGLASSALALDSVIKDINSILQVKLEVNENKELISFSKLVNNISESFSNLNEKKHVRIDLNFSEVDEIFSFKAYMQSIFYNLISNSIKYSRSDVQSLIEIKSKKENGKIILTFKDNGLGIDLKRKGDKIFRLYARFHSHVEGKGMGLFMVKTQVEAIGGKITVVSEVNKGTEFTITFEN
jgi:PAS domain S-box-containing protein